MNKLFSYSRSFVAAATTLLIINSAVYSQIQSSWTAAGNNKNFHNNGNWTNGIPGSEDEAIFGVINPFTVTMDNNAAIKIFSHPIGTMTLNGGNRLTVGTTPILDGFLIVDGAGTELEGQTDMLVGRFELGDLEIRNGGTVTTGRLFTGVFDGMEGFVTVTGNGSSLNTEEYRVGDSGHGVLEISNGAVVTGTGPARIGLFPTAEGEATVTGSGSEWNVGGSLAVGSANGTGLLNIADGGSVFAETLVVLANSNGGTGQINMTGFGSTLNSPLLQIGSGGPGTLVLQGDSEVTANIVNVGSGEFGTGILTITGIASVNTGVLSVGRTGNGTMEINNGTATSTTCIIGQSSTATGMLSVSSSVSDLNCGTLEVGRDGSGDLVIEENGRVDVVGTTSVNSNSQIIFRDLQFGDAGDLISGGEVTVEGKVIFLSGDGQITGDVVLTGNGEIQTAAGGNGIIAGDLESNGNRILTVPTAELTITGEWTGDSPFIGTGLVDFRGTAKPGNSIAAVTFDGDIAFAPFAELEIEIGGLGAGVGHDQMQIDGNVQLDGDLNVVQANGFQPIENQQFLIMEIGGTRTGGFNGLAQGDVVTTIGNAELEILYTAGDGNDIGLIAHVVDVLLGDINLDGSVNLLDVQPFINLISTGTFQAEGDFDMNGVVNLLDVQPFIDLLSSN